MTTALLLKIGAESAALRSDLGKANSTVNQFIGKIQSAGGAIAGALSVGAVAAFTFEVSKLASEAAGVENAFKRIPDSARLLANLTEATKGTVSQLELMKNAVAFKNFNLDIAQLPKLLEFATIRAQQTGQSVDYLVQSIVTGLGRKSVLILDNLGISAAALNAEVAKTGDFFGAVGTIVDQQLVEMGDLIDNNATKVQRFSASWEDVKVAIGEAANGTGVLGTSLTILTDIMDGLAGKNKIAFNTSDLAVFIKEGMTPQIERAVSNLKELRAEAGAPLKIDTEYYIRVWKLSTDQAEQFRKTVAAINGTLSQTEIKNNAIANTVKAAFDSGNVEAYIKALDGNIYKSEIIAEIRKREPAEMAKQQALIENEKNLTDKLNALKEQSLLLAGEARAAANDEIKTIEAKIKALQGLTKAQAAAAPRQPQIKDLAPIKRNNPLPMGNLSNLDTINASIAALQIASTNQLPAVGQSFIDLSTTVQGAMAGMAVGLGNSVGDMLTGVAGIEKLAGFVVSSFGGMAVELGQSMIQFGLAGIALKKFITNPALAIAAGVALVALGKSLSNHANSIVGGGGGSSSGSGPAPQRLERIEYGQQIQLTGEIELRGDKIIAAIKNAERKQNRGLN